MDRSLKAKIKARLFLRKAKKGIKYIGKGVDQEYGETKEMAKSFFKLLESKLHLSKRDEPPTEQEVKEAINQLKDLGRLSVFATISILPGGGVSLLGLEMLAKKFGVRNFTFIPSAFKKKS